MTESICDCPSHRPKTTPEMREIAVESAARVVDAVEQSGLVMLLNELVGPMQD